MNLRNFRILMLMVCAVWNLAYSQVPEVFWKQEVPLPDNQRITLWAENGWLKAVRLNEKDELLWALVIQKWDPAHSLRVDQKGTAVNVYGADGELILRNNYPVSFAIPSVLRANHTPMVWDTKALIDPSLFQIPTFKPRGESDGRGISISDSSGWIYAAIGPYGLNRFQMIVRLMPKRLFEDNIGILVGTDGFRVSTSPYQLYDEDGFLFAEQMSDWEAEQKTQELEPLLDKEARPLSVQDWLNTSSPISLDSLRGSVVLLYFWGVWCPPCVAHLKDVEDLPGRIQSDRFRIITIHTMQGSNRLEAFLREKPFSLPIGIDSGPTSEFYTQHIVPKYVLIDKGGIIRRVSVSAPPVQIIKELLKK